MVVLFLIVSYLLFGAVAGGLITRFTGDDELGVAAIVLWPLFGPMIAIVALYDWVAGEWGE